MSTATWIRISALLGALGVMIGAFGAHSLKATLEANGTLETFKTGSHYHLIHAVALFALSLWAQRSPTPPSTALPSWLWLSGIVIFSGSLYVLSITGVKVLGAITPIGGVLLIAGWLALAVRRFG